MSEFRKFWALPKGKKAPGIDNMPNETRYYKFLVIGGGNAAGYVAKTYANHFKNNPMKLDLKSINSKPIRTDTLVPATLPNNVLMGIVSAEIVPPYERPALSKAFISPDDKAISSNADVRKFLVPVGSDPSAPMQDEKWYVDNKIDLLLGHHAFYIDRDEQVVFCDKKGSRELVAIYYDKLIVATGSRPLFTHMFADNHFSNITVLRNELDARDIVMKLKSLIAAKKQSKKIVIVGGSYIACECAAGFSAWPGVEVSMVYPENHILKKVLPGNIAEWYENFLRSRGVQLLPKTRVKSFVGDGVEDAKGNQPIRKAILTHIGNSKEFEMDADLVLIGIGSLLNTKLDPSSPGANQDEEEGDIGVEEADPSTRGLLVDDHLMTSDPNVYAIGDVAAMPYRRGHRRFEHVDFCRESGDYAATNMLIEAHNFVSDEHLKTDPTKLKPLLALKYVPFHYCRLFEFTDPPIKFNFYGVTEDADHMIVFGIPETLKPQAMGALWIDRNNRVIGGLLCCAPKQASYDEMRNVVGKNLRVKELSEEACYDLLPTLRQN